MPWAVEVYCPGCGHNPLFLGPKKLNEFGRQCAGEQPVCPYCATFMELRAREMTEDGRPLPLDRS